MRLVLMTLCIFYAVSTWAGELSAESFDELTQLDTQEKTKLKQNITDYQPKNKATVQ